VKKSKKKEKKVSHRKKLAAQILGFPVA